MTAYTEDEILRLIVDGKYDIHASLDVERELAKLIMPAVSPNVSLEELLKWGAEFKALATAKIAAKEAEMRAAGELA